MTSDILRSAVSFGRRFMTFHEIQMECHGFVESNGTFSIQSETKNAENIVSNPKQLYNQTEQAWDISSSLILTMGNLWRPDLMIYGGKGI